MTMHMVHPGLSTVNTGKSKKKPSAKQRQATEKHAAWLKKQGLHIDQILARSGGNRSEKLTTLFKTKIDGTQCSNGFAPAGAKNSVFDSQWKRTYEDDPLMAEREKTALKQAKALKSRLMPLYNKGPVQLSTKSHNLKDGNGRGRT
jgi:hypothetical protein